MRLFPRMSRHLRPARSSRRAGAKAIGRAAIEALERRQMLSITSYQYDFGDPAHDSTANWSPSGTHEGGWLGAFTNGEVTLTVNDWAPHVGFTLGGDLAPWHSFATEGTSVTVYLDDGDPGTTDPAVYRYFNDGPPAYVDEQPLGDYAQLGYIPHSGEQVKLRFVGSGFSGQDHWDVLTFNLNAVQPVVSISADDAEVTENTAGDVLSFRVSRTGPVDRSLDVLLDVPGGTATEGTDYQPVPRVVSITAGQTSATFNINTIDDPDAEGIETVALTLKEDGRTYILGNAIQAAGNVDDDVSVSSITVERMASSADHPTSHDAYGYHFWDLVTVRGEHLDQVEIRQMIRSHSDLWDWDGDLMTREEMLAAYGIPQEHWLDSNGEYAVDWGWGPLDNVSENNGVGYVTDEQSHGTLPRLVTVDFGVVKEGHVNALTLDYSIEVRKIGDTSLLHTPHLWGYTWDNFNALWTDEPNGSYCVLDQAFKHGEFTGVYGISGLPWI